MVSVGGELNHAYRAVKRGNWFEILTRVGIASKGVVYVVLGLLAFMAATGTGGETASKQTVITRIARAPLGEVMLITIAVGLFAYSAWRFIAAFKDSDYEGSDARGITNRAGYVLSGLAYSALAITALQILRGTRSAGGDNSRTWAARLLELPMGELIVAAVGVIAIISGALQMKEGYKEEFRKHLTGGKTEWNIRAGKLGHIARGVIFCLMGVFLLIASVRHDPSEAKGLEGTLDTIARQPYGPLLLALTGLGLAAYGAYMFVEAKHRRIRT
jgi:hypothetical protein